MILTEKDIHSNNLDIHVVTENLESMKIRKVNF